MLLLLLCWLSAPFLPKQIDLAFFFQGGCLTMVFQVAKTIVDRSLVFLVLLPERSLYDWKRLVVWCKGSLENERLSLLEEQGILPGSIVLCLFHQKSCFSIPQGTIFIKIVCVFTGFVGRHHQRQRAPSQDWKGERDKIRNTK